MSYKSIRIEVDRLTYERLMQAQMQEMTSIGNRRSLAELALEYLQKGITELLPEPSVQIKQAEPTVQKNQFNFQKQEKQVGHPLQVVPKVQDEQPEQFVQSVQGVQTKQTVQPDLRQQELIKEAEALEQSLKEEESFSDILPGKQIKSYSLREEIDQFVQQEQVSQRKQKKQKEQPVQAEHKIRKQEKQDDYRDLKTQKDRLLYALSELGIHYKDDFASNLHEDGEQFIEEFFNEKGNFSHAILAVIGYYYNDMINLRWLINGTGDPFPPENDFKMAA